MEPETETGSPEEEEARDEGTARICGYDHPAWKPVGRCWRCGGEVWPMEDECWDGAAFHYITFAYRCCGCGMEDVWDFSVKDAEKG